jgi:octaheme c-type cytochrome (tetrathionate reductase family)
MTASHQTPRAHHAPTTTAAAPRRTHAPPLAGAWIAMAQGSGWRWHAESLRTGLALVLALVLAPLGALLLTPMAGADAGSWPTPPASDAPRPQVSGPLSGGTADHTKFEELAGPFADGSEVTQACLGCHTETGEHFMQNIHWTWSYTDPNTGQQLGKKYLINNFCTNARGNEGMCAQCHAGYGWKDESFDFTDESKIDCLVCHETTGTYYKTPNSKGSPACSVMFEGKPPIDLAAAAQSVDLPQRANCGACHFMGGGGDNVKHGDLSSALKEPPRSLDVHMGVDGLNFACTACHVTNKHIWAGSRYNVVAKDTEGTGLPGQRTDVATCESCHGLAPHPVSSLAGFKLNDHVQSIACQTCHIPAFARGGVATIVDWDWRTAGRTRDGEGFHEEGYIQGNGEHRYTYKSIKGDFTYDENIVPEYAWFDGQMVYTTIDTEFDPQADIIEINGFSGSRRMANRASGPSSACTPGSLSIRATAPWSTPTFGARMRPPTGATTTWPPPSRRAWRTSGWTTPATTASSRPCPGGPSPTWWPPRSRPSAAATATRPATAGSRRWRAFTCRGVIATPGWTASAPSWCSAPSPASWCTPWCASSPSPRRRSTDGPAPRQDLQPVRALLALVADAAHRAAAHHRLRPARLPRAVQLRGRRDPAHRGRPDPAGALGWRHFIPTAHGMWGVLRYYSFGIFKGERHPYRKAYWRKHNPLQALAYTMLKLVLFPAIWITGLIYLFYFAWRDLPDATTYLTGVALIHTAAAFAILAFVFIHVYMLTTGHSFREHVMPMITGFDEVELTPEEEAYLRKDQPEDIR